MKVGDKTLTKEIKMKKLMPLMFLLALFVSPRMLSAAERSHGVGVISHQGEGVCPEEEGCCEEACCEEGCGEGCCEEGCKCCNGGECNCEECGCCGEEEGGCGEGGCHEKP